MSDVTVLSFVSCPLNTKVTTLLSKTATPSAVIKQLEDHRFAHFSCHGILETGKPFDASFKLYDDKRLTLLETALLIKGCIFLLQCNILDSGV
jgi:CHAT domain-containing protein